MNQIESETTLLPPGQTTGVNFTTELFFPLIYRLYCREAFSDVKCGGY